MEVAKLTAVLTADTKGFKRDLDSAERSLNDLDGATERTAKSTTGMAGSWKTAGLAVAGFAAAAGAAKIVSFAKDSVRAYSDLRESINAVSVVFGEAASTITDYGETSATAVGMANSEFNQMATLTGALLKNFGFEAQAAADETINLTERAADLASVFNTDVSDAMNAINSALRGETEPIRRYAIDVSEASLQQEALAQGISTSVSAMNQQEKAALRLNAIMRQSTDVAGDFANTSDELANQSRILSARFEDAKAVIGEKFAPVMVDLLDAGMDLLPVFVAIVSSIGNMVSAAASVVKPVADLVGWIERYEIATDGATERQGVLSSAWEFASGSALDKYRFILDVTNSRLQELTGTTEEAGQETAEYAAGSDVMWQALQNMGQSAATTRLEMYELAVAQREHREAIEGSYQAYASQEAFFTRLEAKLRAMQGIRAPWADWGAPPNYYADSQFQVPGASSAPRVRFQSGGMVPGPLGAPRLAVVHGGEEVLTAQQRAERNVTVNMNGNVTSGGMMGDEIALALLMAGVNEQAEFRGLADVRG